jgi:cellulose synthase operon protein B
LLSIILFAQWFSLLVLYYFNKGKASFDARKSMKKITHYLISALMLASLIGGLTFSSGLASSQNDFSSAQTTLSFDLLGQPDTLMNGPYSTLRLRFGLPANWAFQDGAMLQLILTSNLVTDTATTVSPGQNIGASMNVTLNKKLIATLPLVAGTDVIYNIPISASALVSTSNDGRHDLVLSLDASVDCDNTLHHTTVIVSSASYFTLPYNEQSPLTNLSLLPRPIYQLDSVYPVDAVLVVPDTPSAQELQAALIVSAGFGRMTGGGQPFTLVTTSQFTKELRTGPNVIFVGKASTLPLLQDISLPAPLVNNAFNPQGMQPEDGILQMAVSPWNNGRAILVVSGNSDAALLKAAKALSTGALQTGFNPSLAIVAEVASSSGLSGQGSDLLPQTTYTFSDLGYDLITITGPGLGEVAVEFYISPGLVIGEDSYLDLTFNNSALIDFNASGLTVLLNGHAIGDARLSNQTAATVTQRIRISESVVVPGTNQLRIRASLAALSQCSAIDSNLWLAILPESLLHLPLKAAPVSSLDLEDLSIYPYPFINIPTLSDTAFVLSKSPASWAIAAQIASGLGRQAKGSVLDLEVAYDGEIPKDIRDNNDLIIIGLPSDLKIIAELGKSLPGPFEVGSNSAVVNNQQIIYRFSPDIDLGYLELLAAPWDSSHTILAVAGSTENGVKLAGAALVDPTLRSRLKGNFALINGANITVADTRTGLGLGSLNSESTEQTIAPEDTPVSAPSSPATSLTWIPLVVVVLLVLIIIVLFIAMMSARNASRQG